MKLIYFLYCCMVINLLIMTACRSEADKRLDTALELAGENRKELEKVLDHYKNIPQKQAAARFLIEYMPGHGGYDEKTVKDMQEIYDKFERISTKYNWEHTPLWSSEIKEMWNKEMAKLNLSKYTLKQDMEIIQADWLIKQIDMAFTAWNKNIYSQNCSFNDFCKYILPYRVKNGLLIEQNRETFNQRHSGHFQDKQLKLQDAVDSLLYLYKDIKHSDASAPSIALYNTKSLEQVKRGLCEDRAWFNQYLLSALGMPAVTDFVPNWANRNKAHSWNALVIDGETYPFDPFWEDNRRDYKLMYNNKTFDLNWGEFRLPKVYRQTYEYHIDGPMADNTVSDNNIPTLFKTPFIEDVSSEYFETTDIEITIPKENIRQDKYCYLCVYQSNNWNPVQWGLINKNRKVTFKNMGRDIVYQPAFYENKQSIPLGEPIYIDEKGNQQKLTCQSEKNDITIRTYTPQIAISNRIQGRKNLEYTCITASTDLSVKQDTICFLTDSIDAWFNQIDLPTDKPYRYFQFHIPQYTLGLCEVMFYEKDNFQRVSDVKVVAEIEKIKQEETLASICDGLSATGIKGIFRQDSLSQREVFFDLGKAMEISSIVYIPYTYNMLNNDEYFELQYLKDGSWESAGSIKGNENYITFKNVPTGTLYRIKRDRNSERIFMYENGIINWQ